MYIITRALLFTQKMEKTTTKARAPAKGPFLCYVITDHPRRRLTYTGQTNNFARRIRQHNGEIAGGARYTKRRTAWVPLFHVTGFQTLRSVLQFERAMKRNSPCRGPRGRVLQLERVLTSPPHGGGGGVERVVHCFIPLDEYLRLSSKTYDEFHALRTAQRQEVTFVFHP